MNKALHRFAILAVSLLVSCFINAAEPMLGVFSSPKGFGVCLESGKYKTIHAFSAYVDMYGMFSTRSYVPGFKFNYTCGYVFSVIEKEEYDFQFYFGPGCSAGYVHDFEKGKDDLVRNPGGMLALSLTGGCRMPFKDSHFCLDLSFRAEIGAHIRRNEELKVSSLSFYMNGIIQSLAPQLTILYSF